MKKYHVLNNECAFFPHITFTGYYNYTFTDAYKNDALIIHHCPVKHKHRLIKTLYSDNDGECVWVLLFPLYTVITHCASRGPYVYMYTALHYNAYQRYTHGYVRRQLFVKI